MRANSTYAAMQSRLAWRLAKISVLLNFCMILVILTCMLVGALKRPVYFSADSNLHFRVLHPVPKGFKKNGGDRIAEASNEITNPLMMLEKTGKKG